MFNHGMILETATSNSASSRKCLLSRSIAGASTNPMSSGRYALRIELALINGRRRRATLEQAVNGVPGGASGVFEGERNVLRDLHALADESEIGRPLRHDRWPIAV